MLIRCVNQSDLGKILFWIRDQRDCLYWAGPIVRFPASVASLTSDIAFCAGNSYVLEEHEALRAFGQLLDRGVGYYHLARIIVSPEGRRDGYGHLFCKELLRIARMNKCRGISLKVYRVNVSTHSLYRILGFNELLYKSSEEICHMEKRFP